MSETRCDFSEKQVVVSDSGIVPERLPPHNGTGAADVPTIDKDERCDNPQLSPAIFPREDLAAACCLVEDGKWLEQPEQNEKTLEEHVKSHLLDHDSSPLVAHNDDASSLEKSSRSFLEDFLEKPFSNISIITDDRAASDVTCVRLNELLPISQQSGPLEHSCSSPISAFDRFDDDTVPLSSRILESSNVSNSADTNSESPVNEKADHSELRLQLHHMSLRLQNAQDKIEQLLEEKRNWIEQNTSVPVQCSVPPQGGLGELRGRWLQAKNQAESYKREKEAMVMKYAQVISNLI